MANVFLSTLNPKLSHKDTVLIIFQMVRWYGGTGGVRVGYGWGTGGARVGHGWGTGVSTRVRRAAVTGVFSEDGKYLASGSNDCTIGL